ncbi:hypothetical protein [Ignicoccus islandicus]|uniref:hypothetical protein n=1 Tax=Ignicoccus islandicus TaxID=54259 RepID=UPI001F412815|nr:hypothetical protein [Ignicoccus islandicus]
MERRLRTPPKIKVLEALGAIADGRVAPTSGGFKVRSSTGERTYEVWVDLERGLVCSDDNGTKFRGYVGYPIIAVLMLKGKLPFNEKLAEALKGIPWKKLNEEMKSYSKVMELIYAMLRDKGIDRSEVDEFVNEVISSLKKLKLKKVCPENK